MGKKVHVVDPDFISVLGEKTNATVLMSLSQTEPNIAITFPVKTDITRRAYRPPKPQWSPVEKIHRENKRFCDEVCPYDPSTYTDSFRPVIDIDQELLSLDRFSVPPMWRKRVRIPARCPGENLLEQSSQGKQMESSSKSPDRPPITYPGNPCWINIKESEQDATEDDSHCVVIVKNPVRETGRTESSEIAWEMHPSVLHHYETSQRTDYPNYFKLYTRNQICSFRTPQYFQDRRPPLCHICRERPMIRSHTGPLTVNAQLCSSGKLLKRKTTKRQINDEKLNFKGSITLNNGYGGRDFMTSDE